MPEPTLDVLKTQVEIALEEGDLETARRLLESASARLGQQPELILLGRRIQEVRHLARQPTIDSLVQASQERIRVADYEGAMLPLRQALAMAPGDPGLETLVAQTEKAAARHAAAVERQNALMKATREIEALLSRADLPAARYRLDQARSEHGRQSVFDEIELKLQARLTEQQQVKAREHADRAKALRAQEDWHGAFHQADQALTLDPDLADAARLRDEARTQIERLEGQRHLHETVEAAGRDVERLIEAGEVVRAERRLAEASELLGTHVVFSALAQRLDNAKKSQDIKRRSEWAERRANEAEALVQEAARQALGGHFEHALEKLAAAQQMDPDLADLESRRRDYRAALDRRRAQEERTKAMDSATRRTAAALDALHLDDAREMIRTGREQFGDHRRWDALQTRLDGLAQAEQEAEDLPTPERLPSYGIAVKQTLRARERAVAGAYSWKQAFLYPFRSPAIFAALVAFSALSAGAASVLHGLSILTLAAALWLAPTLVAATLDGNNHPPEISSWWRGRRSLTDGLALAAFVGVAGLPLGVLLALGGGQPLFGLQPLLWWLLLAVFSWLTTVWILPACGVVAAFGSKHLWRFGRHVSALTSNPPVDGSLWLIADLLFLWIVLAAVLRVTWVGSTPIVGIPILALLEGYGLLLIPHLIGVVVRSRRLEWADLYRNR